ncbi:MAG TPA: hypothetical protein VH583_09895 [Vicinamibacterales bacterium]|jgi:hypothetical protein
MSRFKEQDPRSDSGEAPKPPTRKRPYQKPAFVRDQLFETMALACGKTNPIIGQCRTSRKNS